MKKVFLQSLFLCSILSWAKLAVSLSTIFSNGVTIHFAAGSASIREQSIPVLHDFLMRAKNISDRNVSILIEGHSDAEEQNGLELSEKRAQAIANYFKENGIDAVRLVVKSLGSTRPEQGNGTPEHRAKNRRVYVHFVETTPRQIVEIREVQLKNLAGQLDPSTNRGQYLLGRLYQVAYTLKSETLPVEIDSKGEERWWLWTDGDPGRRPNLPAKNQIDARQSKKYLDQAIKYYSKAIRSPLDPTYTTLQTEHPEDSKCKSYRGLIWSLREAGLEAKAKEIKAEYINFATSRQQYTDCDFKLHPISD